MSIRVMTAVWDHADVTGGALLVLLAMADHAHDDGRGVYPTQASLATKARMSERNLRYCLDELAAAGYIERDGKHGSVVRWRVEADPANIAGRKPVAGDSGSGLPTEPSEEPSGGETSSPPTGPGTEKDLNEAASTFAGAGKYAQPTTIGEKAAPWLVLELARLMLRNDEKARLPVGLRKPSQAWATPETVRQPDEARELLEAAGWKVSLKPWLDAMRLLADVDERPVREAVQVLRWCQDDAFWKTNILSATKFREKYPALRLRWDEEGGASAPTRTGRPPSTGPSASQMDRMAGRAA